ncbi:MAG: 4Fe-4S dicluster domain-containing protein [Chloroflexi bacterium]|nr:4Fe-4S dicluster domain-containing protein [Chloroflexota bacterium]
MIESSRLDPNFQYEVAAEPGGEHIRRCFSCGTCTVSCPVRAVTDQYNPRKIIRMVLLGLREEVLSSDFIWLCSTCYTCHERCPQDVRITELMNALKNIAVREGHIPPAFRAQVDLLRSHGRLIEIGDYDNERRQELGLPAIHERAADIAKILERTGMIHLGSTASES